MVEVAPDPVAAVERWLGEQPWRDDVMLILERGGLERDDLHVTMLAVDRPRRGEGIGRAVMARIMEAADEAGVPVTLQAELTSWSGPWLEDWYVSLGFVGHAAGWGDWGPNMFRPVPGPSPGP